MDETQAMPLGTLESVRLLTNLETEKRKLMQVVLFGQPELDRKLASESVRQLRQRITFQYRLKALARNEVSDYVAHRLTIAGYSGPALFTNSALSRSSSRVAASAAGEYSCAQGAASGVRREPPSGRATPCGHCNRGHPGCVPALVVARGMSLINKMLQDLDRRQALAGATDASVVQVTSSAAVRRGGREWLWRIVAVLLTLGVGWVIWVGYQLFAQAPRHQPCLAPRR